MGSMYISVTVSSKLYEKDVAIALKVNKKLKLGFIGVD